MNCRICEAKIPDGRLKCPSCNAVNIGGKSITSVANFNDESVLLSEVTEEETKRFDVKYMNYLLGGEILNPEDEEPIYGPGLVKDSVILLAGQPGAGKSTLSLHLADLMVDVTGKEVLYFHAEESKRQIKPRAQRLKLKNLNKIRLVPAASGGVDIGAVIMNRKPGFVIIDSLAGLVGEDDAASVYICKMAKEYAEALIVPILILQHFTKGQEVAGVNTLQHAVDTVLQFFPDEENEDIRELRVDPKNRFGRAYISMYFLMTEHGLEPMPPDFEPADLDGEPEE